MSDNELQITSKDKQFAMSLTSYFEFLSIWGASSNEKNIQRIHIAFTGEQYFHEALAEKKGLVLDHTSLRNVGSDEFLVISLYSNDDPCISQLKTQMQISFVRDAQKS